jgi:membrane protein DedA with SNARE-associated domain
MFHLILSFIANTIIFVITKTGYVGIGVLMALDSCNIPIPSEITMPFAGFLAHNGTLAWWGVWGVIIAGTVGSVVGSWVSYELAGWIVKNRTKNKFLHLLFSDHAVGTAERWFAKYGAASVLVGRVIPVVRTFISLPAGIARMNIKTFLWFTALGSFVWSVFLAYAGYALGARWQTIETYFREVEYGIVIIFILLFVVWFVKKKRRKVQ